MIDWGSALEELDGRHEENVSVLSPSASGNYIHSLLESEYEDIPGLEFEKEISSGRADLVTDDLVYEFKTKGSYNIDKAPLEEDLRQLQRYINSPDVSASEGQLVYINREDFSQVDQYHFSPSYNTDFIADGGLPDFSEYEVYEVREVDE